MPQRGPPYLLRSDVGVGELERHADREGQPGEVAIVRGGGLVEGDSAAMAASTIPTAVRLAAAAPSSITSIRPLLGSLRRAWLAVDSASSLQIVDHNHTPKTSARMSQPTSGAARPAPAGAVAVPPASPAGDGR